jgi:cholesterol 7-dehydrogenase
MMIAELFNVNLWTVIVIILPILYFIYYRKFRIFIYDQPEKVTKGKIVRGKCPPAYPNGKFSYFLILEIHLPFVLGWFWLIDSGDLARGDVKFIQHCGRDVVLFRGHNGKPYVLEAYCAHMGGNLGVGGKVRDINCIECPFHGWIYDGETGSCIFSDGKNKIPRKVDRFEYIDVERCISSVSNDKKSSDYLQKISENQEIKLKTYECREINESIFAWFHADEQLRHKPTYELFNIKDEIYRSNMEGKNKENTCLELIYSFF